MTVKFLRSDPERNRTVICAYDFSQTAGVCMEQATSKEKLWDYVGDMLLYNEIGGEAPDKCSAYIIVKDNHFDGDHYSEAMISTLLHECKQVSNCCILDLCK